mmetsp:Transcript_5646/g.11897  ORF Transcript_5646/g.11897 Transcript_5646/m.11897 type:complete len:152 (+) Transcript_5646:40-495(+)
MRFSRDMDTAILIIAFVFGMSVFSPVVVGSLGVPLVSDDCQVLNAQQCADTCVPLDDGRTEFMCGDWFSKETCCNGTIVESFPGRDYIQCSCESDGLTGAGIGVIVGSIVAALAVAGLITAYVLHRRKRANKAATVEIEKAVEEALEFLPR